MHKESENNINSLGLFVADHVSAMLAYWDKDLVCRFANAAYREWFGKTRDEMVDKITIKELLGPLYEKNLPYISGALEGKKQTFEREIPLPSGEIRYSIANYFPDIDNGKVKGFFVHVADITPVKLLEKELAKSHEIINEQNKRLKIFVAERAQAYLKEKELLNRDIHAHKADKMVLEDAVKHRTLQLEQKNKELESLFQHATMGILVVNSDGEIIRINPCAEKLFQYEKDELIGKKVEILIPKRLKKEHEGYREKYSHNPQPRQMGAEMNLSGMKKDGTEFPVEINLSPFTAPTGNFVTAFIVDITIRKQAEEEINNKTNALEQNYKMLKASEENYRSLFENQLVPMFVTDLKTLKTTVINNVGAQLFGYKSKEDFLANFVSSFHFTRPEERDINIKATTEKGELNKVQEMKRLDGSRFWIKMYIKVNPETAIAHTIAVDVTEQIQAQQQLTTKIEELEKMNKELETFTFISSHDLQEPLRKIKTFATALLEEEKKNLSESGKNYLERMGETVTRMRELIEDLLTYSRSKNADRKFEKTNLSEIAKEVISEFKETIKEKKAVIEADELCEATVIRFQFRQLLHNLISNSLKFTHPERSPYIIIKSEIAPGKELNNDQLSPEINYCHISVSDNGIGFDPKYKDKIFVVFQRLHEYEEYRGTGIGLAICKRIVENHNGIITATGKPGQGVTFDIYIPAL